MHGMRVGFAIALPLLLLGGACGGGAPSATGPTTTTTPTPTPSSGYVYVNSTSGYWGFRIESGGALTPVANGSLSAPPPVFSADGSKVAFWDFSSIAIRPVRPDGTFGEVAAKLSVTPPLLNRSGSAGYFVRWSPTGDTLLLIGGHGNSGTTNSPRYFDGEVLAFRYSGNQLSALAGNPVPGGYGPAEPLFLSGDVVVIRYCGVYGGITYPSILRTYEIVDGGLRAAGIVDEPARATVGQEAPFLSQDRRLLMSGAVSYAISGSALKPVSRLPDSDAPYGIETTARLRDPYVMTETISSLQGAEVISSFRLNADGSFARLASITDTNLDYFFFRMTALQGRMVVMDGGKGTFGTTLVDGEGGLSPFRKFSAPSWARENVVSTAQSADGRYFYFFSRVAAASLGLRFGEDGSITFFNPLPPDTSFGPTVGPTSVRP